MWKIRLSSVSGCRLSECAFWKKKCTGTENIKWKMDLAHRQGHRAVVFVDEEVCFTLIVIMPNEYSSLQTLIAVELRE